MTEVKFGQSSKVKAPCSWKDKICLSLLTIIKREMKETRRGPVFPLIHAAVM